MRQLMMSAHRGLNLLTVMALVLLLVFVGFYLHSSYKEAMNRADNNARKLASAAQEHAERTIRSVDLMLSAVVRLAASPQQMEHERDILGVLLTGYLNDNPQLRDLVILDPEGNLRYSVVSAGVPNLFNFADRRYFGVHREPSQRGLYISQPLMARVDERPFVAMSRRLEDGRGRFQGVVMAVLEPNYFQGFYRRLRSERALSVALYRSDGTLLLEERFGLKSLRDILGPDGRLPADLNRQGEPVNLIHPAPGRDHRHYRLYSQPVPGLPVMVVVAQARDLILAPLTGAAVAVVLISAGAAVVILVLSLAAARNLRSRQQALDSLMAERNLSQALVHHLPGVFYLIDARQRMSLWNDNFVRVTGYSHEQIGTMSPLDFFQGHDRKAIHRAIEQVFGQGEASVEAGFVTATGETLPYSFWGRSVMLNGRPHLLGMGFDISERRHYQARLERQANYDELTGLPNRNLLRERLSQALERAGQDGEQVAVLCIDLDRFRRINDSLGHEAGDDLLRQVARRLEGRLRTGDTLARPAGDEFVMILEGLTGEEQALAWARTLMEDLEAPLTVAGQSLCINSTMGISLYPRDGQDAPALLKSADTALNEAKSGGSGSLCCYAHPMHERTLQRLALEGELRQALALGELELHYQPQAALEDGHLVGVEALLRWYHPRRGPISPARFIPIAEDSGLINPIGDWVLETACHQARAWQRAGLGEIRMGVNLSSRQFLQPDLPQRVARALEHSGLEARYLELEITESMLMQNVEEAIATLRAFKSMGVSVAIDDFGTGYSSLSYLKHLPVDRLKIDRSFVRDIVTDGNDAAIAQAVINLAHDLSLKVIAEGVEEASQLDFLRRRGCDEIQGYYLSHPLPHRELENLLQQRHILTLEQGRYPPQAQQ